MKKRSEKPYREECTRYECFWKHIIHPRFADVLLKLAQATIQFFSKGTRKGRKPSRVMMTCRVLPIVFDLQSLSEMYGLNWLDPSKAFVALNLYQSIGLICQSSKPKLEMLGRISKEY